MQKRFPYRFRENNPADGSFLQFLVFGQTVFTQDNSVARQQPEIPLIFFRSLHTRRHPAGTRTDTSAAVRTPP